MSTELTDRFAAVLVGVCFLVGWSSPAATDWCAEINAAAPGEEIVVPPGNHEGGCAIVRGGRPGSPVVLRGRAEDDRPRIRSERVDRNLIEIRASHVVLRGLELGPSPPGVDGIRVIRGDDVVIEASTFIDVGGVAVVANHSSVHGLTVRRNEVLRSRSTAMYFGCHDGVGCRLSRLLVESNYIHGVEAAGSEIGYGIQVKLNSSGTIRDNVVIDAKGPGIMVYGSTGLGQDTLVERNFVVGSRTSSGIVIGGGPAVVRNNIAVASAAAGITVEDYGRRDLLRGIAIVHNTASGNAHGGLQIRPGMRMDVKVLNNAADARPGSSAFPPAMRGVHSAGNVDCTRAACFRAPGRFDFSPSPGSPLIAAAPPMADPSSPDDDYFGQRRGPTRTIGAVELPGRAITLPRRR